MKPNSHISRTFLLLAFLFACGAGQGRAQAVQPVIAEFNKSADGFLQVTNDGGTPQIVTLEPKSFSLNEDGSGTFRPLDPSIHLELSTTSVRLEPRQSARVFYKVKADALPAWLCIYASFSPAKEAKGVNLRVMLPHTVYVYQKDSLQKADIQVEAVHYDRATHRVTASLVNRGGAAGRVSQVELNGSHASEVEGGFPMLPGMPRTLSLDWKSEKDPEMLALHFQKFDLKVPVPVVAE